jgi:hypothetical protein
VVTRAELRVSAPWGDGDGAVPLSATTQPSFGEASGAELRQVPAPLRIALDPRGGVHALAGRAGEPATVVHFSDAGAAAGRTRLAPDPPERIAGFAVDAEGAVHALGADGTGGIRLRSFAPGGGEAWCRSGAELGIPATPGAAPPRLLLDGGSRLHLALDDGRGTVLRLDRGGDVEHVFHTGAAGNRAFLTPDGRLVAVTWRAEAGRRAVVEFDPREGRSVERPGNVETHRWLTWPLGVDAEGRLYAWHLSALARVDAEGGVEPLGRVEQVVARPADGAVFLAWTAAGGGAVEVEVHRPGAEPSSGTLALPTGGGSSAWGLAHVDGDDRRYLLREAPGSPPEVAVHAPGGERVATGGMELLPDESRLQPPDSWRVDPSGRLYLPVLDGAGFRVVRLTPGTG